MTGANVSVRFPATLFTEPHSFKSAANGKIYIGKPGKDPTIPANRLSVYIKDVNGTAVQIPQPVSINAAGYPVYLGSVVEVLTEGTYSMAVYDTLSVQLYYFPLVAPPADGTGGINSAKFISVPETSVAMLPNVDERKNKLFGFDAYGDPLAIVNGNVNYQVVEIQETTAPSEKDPQVYISIGGYRVPAWRMSQNRPAIGYPNVPVIVAPVYGFRAAVNFVYRIPFTLMNAEISKMSVTSDNPDRFSSLSVERLTQSSGALTFVTNFSSSESLRSAVTLSDNQTGATQTFNITHSYSPVNALIVDNVKVSGGQITVKYNPAGLPGNNSEYVVVLEPDISVSQKVKYVAARGQNYFNQASTRRRNQSYTPYITIVKLLQAYSGTLEIVLKDAIGGLSVSVFTTVNYDGS